MGDVTSCQFFLPELYAIKIVVAAYSFLAYDIVFFKIIINVFFRSRFLKYFFQTWLKARAYANIIYEVWN